MTLDAKDSIIVTVGHWMHIPCVRIHHRRYPEVRGEGHTLAEATAHLLIQLDRALGCAPGRRRREAIERALADVRALRPAGTRGRRRPPAAIA